MLTVLIIGFSITLLFFILHNIQLRKNIIIANLDKIFYQQALLKFPSFYLYNTVGQWNQFLLKIGDKVYENLDDFLINFPNYTALKQQILALKENEGAFTLLVKNNENSFLFEGRSLEVNSKVVGMVLFVYDISEYQAKNLILNQQCSELQKKNLCYQTILEKSPYIIWQINKEGKLMYANPLFKKIRSKGTGYEGRREEVLIIKSIPKLYSIEEVSDEENIYGYGHEISEVGELRQELAQCKKLQEALLEYSPNGMIIFGADFSLQWYNGVFFELFNIDEDFLKTQPKFREVINYLVSIHILKYTEAKDIWEKETLIFSTLGNPYQFYFNIEKKEIPAKIYAISLPYFKGTTLVIFNKIT